MRWRFSRCENPARAKRVLRPPSNVQRCLPPPASSGPTKAQTCNLQPSTCNLQPPSHACLQARLRQSVRGTCRRCSRKSRQTPPRGWCSNRAASLPRKSPATKPFSRSKPTGSRCSIAPAAAASRSAPPAPTSWMCCSGISGTPPRAVSPRRRKKSFPRLPSSPSAVTGAANSIRKVQKHASDRPFDKSSTTNVACPCRQLFYLPTADKTPASMFQQP